MGETKHKITIFTLFNRNINLLLKNNQEIEITKPNMESMQEIILYKGKFNIERVKKLLNI